MGLGKKKSIFEVKELALGVKLIVPFYVEDERGYSLKCYEKDFYSKMGMDGTVQESFESYSKRGVVRGMHFQIQKPQTKIVRAIKGEVHDIVVDMRLSSPTFGQYVEQVLSDENHYSLWVPAGFAHGFEVLSDDATVLYHCIGAYYREFDAGVAWNDSELNLPWQVQNPILSEKDKQLPTIAEMQEKRRL